MAVGSFVGASSGLLVAFSSQLGGPDGRATVALHRLGYSTLSASFCTPLVPREWNCLVGRRQGTGRFGWVHFHRADGGAFVVRERRAGQLAP
jgi:hypothetical protein